MSTNFKTIFILTLFTFTANLSFGSEKILKEFMTTEYSSPEDVIKEKTLVVLFQPGCRACKKLIKNLDCVKNYTDNIVLIGSFGSEEKLQKTYLKRKVDYKGYYVNEDKVISLGFEEGIAPQAIFKSGGKQISFIGNKSCKKLEKIFKGNDETPQT